VRECRQREFGSELEYCSTQATANLDRVTRVADQALRLALTDLRAAIAVCDQVALGSTDEVAVADTAEPAFR
jgi:hypothetical protein